MNEEKMKNYSIRLGSEEVGRLERFLRIHGYWKRSGVIRGILLGVFKALSDTQIYGLVRFGYGESDIKVTITITK